MKRIVLFSWAVFLCSALFGQNSTGMPSGNIGIGTTNPQIKLQVVGGNIAASTNEGLHGFTQLWSDNSIMWRHGNPNGGLRFGSATDLSAGNYSEKMIIRDNGRVGIGITNPEFKFDVVTANALDAISLRGGSGFARMHANTLTTSAYNYITQNGDGGLIFSGGSETSTNGFVIAPWQNSKSGIRIDNNGNVGVGTFNTSDNNFNLFVEKGIRTRKIKVDQTAWADFVFAPSYQLRPVHELRTFIQTHRHLPDVPSEKEVTANGQDLGEMNKILLQKIEELTLYMIDQHETITELKARLSKLEQK